MKTILYLMFSIRLCFAWQSGYANDLSEYGLKGKVKKEIYCQWIDGKVVYKTVVHYDEYGNRSMSQYFEGDTIASTSEYSYKYNEQGKLVEELEESWRTVFTYDKNGVLSETNRYRRDAVDPDSGFTERQVYVVANDPTYKEIDSYAPGGSLNSRDITRYNSAGAVTEYEMITEHWKQMPSRWVLDYDSKGCLKSKMSYTGEGKLVENKTYSGTETDKYKNWIKRTEHTIDRENVYHVTETRELEYY